MIAFYDYIPSNGTKVNLYLHFTEHQKSYGSTYEIRYYGKHDTKSLLTRTVDKAGTENYGLKVAFTSTTFPPQTFTRSP